MAPNLRLWGSWNGQVSLWEVSFFLSMEQKKNAMHDFDAQKLPLASTFMADGKLLPFWCFFVFFFKWVLYCFLLHVSSLPFHLEHYSTSSKLPLHSSKTSFGINLVCKTLADLLPFNHFSLVFSDTKTAHSTHPPIQNQSEATATNRLRDTPYLLAGIKNRVQNTGFHCCFELYNSQKSSF